eukprot:3912236-Pyramimonas_sp.AAC.1
MPWVKIYVCEALEAAHYQVNGEMPRVVSRAHVDGIAQDMAGTEQELLAHVLPAATLFAQEVDKLGLALSGKSAL